MQTISRPQGWPLPNYENPTTRGAPSLFIITLVVTTIVVVLRFYSRYFLTRSPGIDDTFLLAGYVLSFGQTFAGYKALTTWGWNMHLWDVPPTRLELVRLSAWLNQFFFIFGTGCTKISILLVYRRISTGSSSMWFVRLTWAAIAFTVIYALAFLLELMLVCYPLNAYWKSYSITYTSSFKCADERVPVVLSAAASVFSDIYASVLPMLLVRKLQLSRRQRISLFVLFSAGLLTAGAGIVRLYYLTKVTKNYQMGPHTHDGTWLGWPLYAWTDVEAHLAIICASAPALKVFFTQKLQVPLLKARTASRFTPSGFRSPSRFRSPSSKKNVQLDESRSDSGAALTSHHQSRLSDQSLKVELTPSTNKGQDLEKFSQEKTDDIEKPLPTWPASGSSSPPAREANMTWSVDGSSSSDGESSGSILPIYVPKSRYNRHS